MKRPASVESSWRGKQTDSVGKVVYSIGTYDGSDTVVVVAETDTRERGSQRWTTSHKDGFVNVGVWGCSKCVSSGMRVLHCMIM